MTVEEAIERLVKKLCHEKEPHKFCRDACMYGEECCEVQVAKMCMEKQIQKKPIYRDFKEDDEGEKMIPHKAECPVCGYEFEFGEWNDIDTPYCKCGQKLDWEEGGC